jgi:hypothetical protein
LAETKSKRTRTQKAKPTLIVRDNTFSRAVVDKTLVMDLGRDLEIACFQVGPELVRLSRNTKVEEFEAETVLTEVARLRLPLASALGMAMSILQTGIEKDMVNVAGLIETINGFRNKPQSISKLNVNSDAE